jgi:two-component system phosphate regulon sensor histidine kinase PhoR
MFKRNTPINRIIPILEITTAIAVSGLLAFQLFRIGEDKRTKEEWFKITVNAVLDEVVSKIEKDEVVFRITGSLSEQQGYTFSQTKYNIQTLRKQQDVFEVNMSDSISLGSSRLPISDPAILQMLSSTLEKTEKMNTDGNPTTYRRVLVDNIVESIIAVDIPIEERINKDKIDALFAQAFKNHGLKLSFNYEVRGDSCLLFGSGMPLVGETFSRRLFPSDPLVEPYTLYLCFPKQNLYIYKAMGTAVFASMGLLIVVMIIFLGTLREIFRQKKMSQVRTDFISNMTHELKTPITTIMLATEMLKMLDHTVTKSSVNPVETIHTEAKKLLMLVEQVLNVAKYESNKFKLKLAELDAHIVINRVVSTFAIQAANKNAQITTHLGAQRTHIMADVLHFSNIVSNLIENALKYSKTAPIIDVATRNDRNNLVIQISDNGIGIAAEDQPHIFEQFYRAHTGNLHNVKGFGLGLNYVKKMVDGHNGTISVESKAGNGSIFTISIPIA